MCFEDSWTNNPSISYNDLFHSFFLCGLNVSCQNDSLDQLLISLNWEIQFGTVLLVQNSGVVVAFGEEVRSEKTSGRLKVAERKGRKRMWGEGECEGLGHCRRPDAAQRVVGERSLHFMMQQLSPRAHSISRIHSTVRKCWRWYMSFGSISIRRARIKLSLTEDFVFPRGERINLMTEFLLARLSQHVFPVSWTLENNKLINLTKRYLRK